MSHIVTIQTKVHDHAAINSACTRLGLNTPVEGSANLYSGEANGLIVQLPDWKYPLVIDTVSGGIKFDNYNGHWGEQRHLDHFLQIYAVEKAKQEARKKGFTVSEQALQDGSIKLQIHEGS